MHAGKNIGLKLCKGGIVFQRGGGGGGTETECDFFFGEFCL